MEGWFVQCNPAQLPSCIEKLVQLQVVNYVFLFWRSIALARNIASKKHLYSSWECVHTCSRPMTAPWRTGHQSVLLTRMIPG